jgi:hypothetical protein
MDSERELKRSVMAWQDNYNVVVKELADLRQVAQGLRADVAILENNYRESVEAEQGLQEQITKHDYTIGEWKKEEVLWKEREADLQDALVAGQGAICRLTDKLSVARECLTLISTTYAGTKEIKLLADEVLAQIEGTK